jgi:Virulence factor BrkB
MFEIYVRKMQFGLLYGTLAAAIGVMVWMELCAMVIFLGAAWNAESIPMEEEAWCDSGLTIKTFAAAGQRAVFSHSM